MAVFHLPRASRLRWLAAGLTSCAVEQDLVRAEPPAPSPVPAPEPVAPPDTARPAPDDTALPEPVLGLLVVELMIDPAAVDDAAGEWFELLSTSSEALVLNGLTFADDGVDDTAVVAEGRLVLDPGARLVVCANGDRDANGGVTCGATWPYSAFGGGLALSNATDELEIALDGVRLDRVAWRDGFAPVGAAVGQDDAGAWCPASALLDGGDRGTPGEPNPDCPVP